MLADKRNWPEQVRLTGCFIALDVGQPLWWRFCTFQPAIGRPVLPWKSACSTRTGCLGLVGKPARRLVAAVEVVVAAKATNCYCIQLKFQSSRGCSTKVLRNHTSASPPASQLVAATIATHQPPVPVLVLVTQLVTDATSAQSRRAIWAG